MAVASLQMEAKVSAKCVSTLGTIVVGDATDSVTTVLEGKVSAAINDIVECQKEPYGTSDRERGVLGFLGVALGVALSATYCTVPHD